MCNFNASVYRQAVKIVQLVVIGILWGILKSMDATTIVLFALVVHLSVASGKLGCRLGRSQTWNSATVTLRRYGIAASEGFKATWKG